MSRVWISSSWTPALTIALIHALIWESSLESRHESLKFGYTWLVMVEQQMSTKFMKLSCESSCVLPTHYVQKKAITCAKSLTERWFVQHILWGERRRYVEKEICGQSLFCHNSESALQPPPYLLDFHHLKYHESKQFNLVVMVKENIYLTNSGCDWIKQLWLYRQDVFWRSRGYCGEFVWLTIPKGT